MAWNTDAIWLNSPMIVVSDSTSARDIQSQLPDRQFGVVEQIFAGCFSCAVGDLIFYDVEGIRQIQTSDNVSYWLVDENKIIFREIPVP